MYMKVTYVQKKKLKLRGFKTRMRMAPKKKERKKENHLLTIGSNLVSLVVKNTL